MIINPIIPIWLMSILCITAVIYIIFDKSIKDIISKKQNNDMTTRQKQVIKKHRINVLIKICIIITLFVINLRIMLPNGESVVLNSDYSVLFVIDKSVSMKALDYNGQHERFEGVISDCCNIVEELSGSRFSIITFGDTAKRIIPFTTDSDMTIAQLKAINLEDDMYAQGSSMNLVKDTLEDTLKKEQEKKKGIGKIVLFFITDGEITKKGETLDSFASISNYVADGAVMGYGTKEGGKMINSIYEDSPDSKFYYIYYYDDNYNFTQGVSKIDENNLKKIAEDIKIDYVQMDKPYNITYKINDIKKQILSSQKSEDKITSYQDTYYYFSIPLVCLLIVDFVNKKRRM